MAEILDTVGVTADTIENLLRADRPDRAELFTKFEETTRGRARAFSHANTLELTLIASFGKAGVPPRGAIAMAAAVLRAKKSGGTREWWAFAAGNTQKGIQFQTLNSDELKRLVEGAWPPVFTIVHVGEIVRRVDKLYEEK